MDDVRFQWTFKSNVILCCCLFILYYLLFNTGLHGDDYSAITESRFSDLYDFLAARGVALNILGSYYCFWWVYPFLGYEHQWVYDLVKVFAHLLSVYFVYRFAVDYLPRDRAMLASVVFVLYPLHDATMYWYMTSPYIFFPAILMLAHAMIRHNRFMLGILFALLGAFGGYFSPPYTFGLAVIFLLERKYRKAVIFAFPGTLYIVYYFFLKYALPGIERRINSRLTTVDFLRQLALQPLSFIDAAIGPSYWLKIFYSIASLGLFSALIALSIVVFLFIQSPSFSKKPDFPKSLFSGLLSLLLLSFMMFALTGLYHHSAFNLGNRTTVYGSLLIAFYLALLPLNKKTILFFSLIYILPVFGLSDYWKSWNSHQKAIIENIHVNPSLKTLEPESTLLVTGNIYSKLGPISHIKFFSMPWLVNSILHDLVKSQTVVALTPYIYLDKGVLIDPKYGGEYPLRKKIYLYRSDINSVTRVLPEDVPRLLADRPREIRHWVQLAKGSWIESGIVSLSPRLAYLFL